MERDKLLKSKFYAVNIRRGIINPKPFTRSRDAYTAFGYMSDVIIRKGSVIQQATSFEYFRVKPFVTIDYQSGAVNVDGINYSVVVTGDRAEIYREQKQEPIAWGIREGGIWYYQPLDSSRTIDNVDHVDGAVQIIISGRD